MAIPRQPLSDHRDLDLVIEQLGDELLEAQTIAVEFRALALGAVDALHHVTAERERLREQLCRVIGEFRAFREQVRQTEAA